MIELELRAAAVEWTTNKANGDRHPRRTFVRQDKNN
jgi:hypothetical protein